MNIKLKLNVSISLIFVSLISIFQSQAQCHIDDWTALKALYESTEIRANGWYTSFNNKTVPLAECNLAALSNITLNAAGRVDSISFNHNYLRGTIPPEIGNLTQLTSLSLVYNNLVGAIPPEIGNLKELTWLNLNGNDLSNAIPPEIGNLTQLTNLYLGENNLTGAIPPEIGNCTQLASLSLDSNNLTGTIPAEIGNLTHLTGLSLGWNELSGKIPLEINNLKQLEYISIPYNQLTGSIPPSLGNLNMLSTIILRNNQLTGSIPAELADLSNLDILSLNNNQLTGSIPFEIANLPLLRVVRLQNNQLIGKLPSGFGLLKNLVYLNVSSNQLSGCFHPDLAALCNRNFLSLSVQWNNFDASWDDFCLTGEAFCDVEEEVIFGCLDATACNYNPNTNYVNNSCVYYDPLVNCPCDKISGCTDPEAKNFNALANCDNGFCEYENALLPGVYNYVFCYESVLVNLKKMCPFGLFEITENTSNTMVSIDEDGLLSIDNPNIVLNSEGVSVVIDNPTIYGTVKITLKDDEIRCNSEWIFNLDLDESEHCRNSPVSEKLFVSYPWLSHLVELSNCSNDAIQLYSRIVEGDIIIGNYVYVTTERGGVLYTDEGEFVCTDYENGESTCADRYDLNSVDRYWVCSNNSYIIGCTNPNACNYLPTATLGDLSCTYSSCIDALEYVECPSNDSTTICAPVSTSPLRLINFVTTDAVDILNKLSLSVQEQTNVQQYFTITTYNYVIQDESGNEKTCETKYHVANQTLKTPYVTPPGTICEEDLWIHIKIGRDQYKIYADQNGTKGSIMSTCNTPSLVCSTADFGIDTKVSSQYNFWASTYFEFPDGSICESEAAPFYVDVEAKPTATLSTQNKTLNIGEGLSLMDVVSDNKSGYWTGENIIYLMTVTGENTAYFSANGAGTYKLYYTVNNDNCEQSYLLVVEVPTVGKAAIAQTSYKPMDAEFNMYPNPTSNKVFIDLPDEAIYQITLMDISGKIIKQIKTRLDASFAEIEVSNLSKGMYLATLKNEETQTRLSKQRIQKLIIE